MSRSARGGVLDRNRRDHSPPDSSREKNAAIGGDSVVTKYVPDYTVAVGNPANVMKQLDPISFPVGSER